VIVPQIVFWVMAVIAVLGGLGVIASHQPIRSVLSLVAVMLALSVIFLELSAQFVFAVQVIVYAGAVMVLFLFVVALLGPMRERPGRRLHFQWGLSIVVALVFGAFMYTLLGGVGFRAPDKMDLTVFGTVEQIGAGLFTRYLYPFELTSILLLVAAVGAIYLSRGGRTATEIHREEAGLPAGRAAATPPAQVVDHAEPPSREGRSL
jgi:NADH-quinone oxidoreductase subunit J